MPSIFKSINRKERKQGVTIGEFGSLNLQGSSSRSSTTATPPRSPLSPTSPADLPPAIPAKYTFLPTHIPHRTSSDNSIDSTKYSDLALEAEGPGGLPRAYGFLSGIGAKVVLSLEDVRRVVQDVSRELEQRGLVTPMLFSALALEANQSRAKLLIQAFLDTMANSDLSNPSSSSSSHSRSFASDLHYAKEHELAWLLRWALSRVTKRREGTWEICHGLIEWEVYEEWRGRERSAGYPSDAFPYLSGLISSQVYLLIQPIFQLLSRLAAHSHLSGLTPHALSSYFAPLLFDIPVHSAALTSHHHFNRAAAATEHLLLAYIRSSSRNADLGLNDRPGRLKEWVSGYPSMVISDNDLAKGRPRRGARVVRCERATRTVRAYSKDLVATAETWVERKDQWEAWDRVVLRDKRGDQARPNFTQTYRRRMVVKEQPSLPLSSGSIPSAGPTVYGLPLSDRKADWMVRDGRAREHSDEDGRWGSLAGKEWSMFEEGGFGAEGNNLGDKLRFDLTESAKLSITERRKTMDWTDFASADGGFTRTDPALSTTLSLSKPIETSIEQWPKERSNLDKRLHRSQKDSIAFDYDTRPKFDGDSGWSGDHAESSGESVDPRGRVYLEEAFVEFWADIAMGCGWVDRAELTFRECNWAILEYKASMPGETEVHPRDDPRTGSLYFLFEEKVPFVRLKSRVNFADYQFALANPQQKRTFSIFSPKRKKAPAPAPTRAGLSSSSSTYPNIASLTINSRAPGNDFGRMLLNRSATKKVSLSGQKGQEATIWHKQIDTSQDSAGTGDKKSHRIPVQMSASVSAKQDGGGGGGGVRFVVKSREKALLPAHEVVDPGVKVKGDEVRPNFFARGMSMRKGRDKEQKIGSHGEVVDFEIQSASGVGSPGSSAGHRHMIREDDKWMGKSLQLHAFISVGGARQAYMAFEALLYDAEISDILVANGARRMDRQDAPPLPRPIIPPTSDIAGTSSPRHRDARAPSPPSPPLRAPALVGSPDRPPALQSHHTPDASGEPDEELHTPHPSGFSPSTGVSTAAHVYLEPAIAPASPDDPTLPPELPSRELPLPLIKNIPLPRSPDSDSAPRESDEYRIRESWSTNGSDRMGVQAPAPYRVRDTIHNIVDTYRDSVGDEGSNRSSMGMDDMYASEEGGTGGSRDDHDHDHHDHTADEEEIQGGVELPPKVFDLTPTREPTPGRYRHGEALHFGMSSPFSEQVPAGDE